MEAVTPIESPAPIEVEATEPRPDEAGEMFGDRLELATRYAALLTGRGRLVGVLGPRENGRIWSRHLVNSAALAPLIPAAARVTDVGSGAGLPGIPLALARPDLSLRLVDSLARRIRFLREAVVALELGDQVEVVHARAEELQPGSCDVVTARAVANLPTLLTWCLPLVPPRGGLLLALRGLSAEEELVAAGPALKRAKATGELVEVAAMGQGPPARVIRVIRR